MRMIYLNEPHSEQSQQLIYNINDHINRQKPTVIYFYKEGCPYCMDTSPKWKIMQEHIKITDPDLLAIEMNKVLYDLFQKIGEPPKIFPTIRYIHKNRIDHFTKDGEERTAETIAKWIDDMTQQKFQQLNPTLHNSHSHDYRLKKKTKRVRFKLPYNNNFKYTKKHSSIRQNTKKRYPSRQNRKIKRRLSRYTSNKYKPYSNQFFARNFNKQPMPIMNNQNENMQNEQNVNDLQNTKMNKSKSIMKKVQPLYKSIYSTKPLQKKETAMN